MNFVLIYLLLHTSSIKVSFILHLKFLRSGLGILKEQISTTETVVKQGWPVNIFQFRVWWKAMVSARVIALFDKILIN